MHIVECRRRIKVHGVERDPPQSGDTFWQLELINEPYRGKYIQYLGLHNSDLGRLQCFHCIYILYCLGNCFLGRPLQWKDRCRIKHLPSQLYVAVVKVSAAKRLYQVSFIQVNLPACT